MKLPLHIPQAKLAMVCDGMLGFFAGCKGHVAQACSVQISCPNPLTESPQADSELQDFCSQGRLEKCREANGLHLGISKRLCQERNFAKLINPKTWV